MAQTRVPSRQSATGRLPGKRPAPNKSWGIGLYLAVFVCGTLGAGTTGSFVGISYAFTKLPDVATLQSYVPFETTMIFDAKRRVVAKVHGEENRVVVPLGEIPKVVQNAVVAAEDIRFYQHPGVDVRGIARALLKDLAGGRAEEGASTLTQQLAKNLFLTPSKTISRKLADAWLAIQIERRYSKDQILELYLNQVYWGHNAYGIESASHTFFGKSVRYLNLAEGALLAGLLGGPERYSPYRNAKLAKQNQRIVLRKLEEGGFITANQAKNGNQFALSFPKELPRKRETYRAPYFTNFLLEQLVTRYGADVVFKGGLRVFSTLDLNLQLQAEALLRETIDKYGKRYRFSQGAMVAIDTATGAIRAMIGGYDWDISKFNRALQALRQPGSAFKPFVYLTAFSEDVSPAAVFNDTPQSYLDGAQKWWTPQNYANDSHGSMTLRKALETSNNIIAVKLINRIGPEKVVETAHRIGIQSQLEPNLSIALGTSEVTPLDLCTAFGVFAKDGKRTEPIAYWRVEDRAGTVLEQRVPRLRQVFPPIPVRVLNDVLQGVIKHGTGYAARIGRPAAGKTGTTSDHRDAWFVGYTPDLVGIVWLGNDDNSRMAGGTTGGEVCAPLWAKFMRLALKESTVSTFVKPERIPEVSSVVRRRFWPRTESAGKLPQESIDLPHDGAGEPVDRQGRPPERTTRPLLGPPVTEPEPKPRLPEPALPVDKDGPNNTLDGVDDPAP